MHSEGNVADTAIGRRVVVDGRAFLNFAGCSYLDLSGHPEVILAAQSGAKDFGLGNDLGYGILGRPIHDIEDFGAKLLGFEACLYCTSAYVGSLVVATLLASRVKRAFIDESSHYSIRHGLRLAGIEAIEFAHCNPADLSEKLRANADASGRCVVMTDGVFPTWGNIAPLDAYASAARGYNAAFVVDDAHGTGVLGDTGAGTLEHLSIRERDNWFLIASLSKGIGGQGALIGMSRNDFTTVKSSNVVYNSVSLPTMATAAAGLRALHIAREPWLRENILRAKDRLCEGLAILGIKAPASDTPIVTFSLGTSRENRSLFDALRAQGFLVILSSYVGAPSEGAIRITLMSTHTSQDVDDLVDAIAAARKR
jgi:8-amino-7-oxononanoate synthase